MTLSDREPGRDGNLMGVTSFILGAPVQRVSSIHCYYAVGKIELDRALSESTRSDNRSLIAEQ
jgi:hypothetical protein